MRITLPRTLCIVFAVAGLSACSRDPQRAAFDEAAAREPGGRTEEVVAAYERAAAMNPSSELGLKASHKATELRKQAAQQVEAHKAVFQEHGVD